MQDQFRTYCAVMKVLGSYVIRETKHSQQKIIGPMSSNKKLEMNGSRIEASPNSGNLGKQFGL